MVTGGAGFIGSHVVEAIVKQQLSAEVISVVDILSMGDRANLSKIEGHHIQVVEQDLTNYERVSQLIAKHSVDVVIHLAVTPLVYSLVEPVVGYDHIVAMQQNLLECQRKGLFQRLISFSTSEVYGGMSGRDEITEESPLIPATPYAAAKASADLLALSYVNSFDLDVTIVRPFNNYGPRKKVLKRAGIIPTVIRNLSRDLPVRLYGGGAASRDFVYVEDTAQGVLKILEADHLKGEVLHIASGVSRTMRDVVTNLGRIMGVEPVIEDLPGRQGDVAGLKGSMAKTRSLIDYEPVTTWEDGLRQCVEYYQ